MILLYLWLFYVLHFSTLFAHSHGAVKIYAQIYLQAPAEWSQPAIEASYRAASKCFMFMYFLLPHWVPATWRSRAQTSIRAELPSGNVPTTRVRRRISRFSRSITLFVRMRVQCARWGNHSRSASPQCHPRLSWRPPSASLVAFPCDVEYGI